MRLALPTEGHKGRERPVQISGDEDAGVVFSDAYEVIAIAKSSHILQCVEGNAVT